AKVGVASSSLVSRSNFSLPACFPGHARRTTRFPFATTILLVFAALLCCTAFVSERVAADDSPPATAPGSTSSDSVEQVIVEGKPIAQLRLRIRIAEDAFYDRFNEINSDDRYDIHCSMRAITGSRIQHRSCEYQGWSDAAENYAASLLGQ